ncbi:uncharacterized protein At4g29660 isoform X1 [Punica granatum]|uniref:Uncharacterized protein At4g29660 isoform X1 n=3 Tax=Punica granatum TaxID=22663 RepID=A0A6P8DBY2_PUNGR|nr:uncharacterized protein At4g29660 isoform X1 [Punica granatum]
MMMTTQCGSKVSILVGNGVPNCCYASIGSAVHKRNSAMLPYRVTSYLWRKYADYLYTKWEKNVLWTMVDPYRRPKSFTPLVTIYVAAFYTGVIGAAITEQLYKERYWEEHPGEAVPLMRPKFYGGPWKVYRGDALPPNM